MPLSFVACSEHRGCQRARRGRCPAHWRKVIAADERARFHNGTMSDPDDPDAVTAAAASHLARNLASLRHTRALTQEALAKAAAVPRSTIANLESGAGNPSLTVLVKVAAALGAPIDELLASPRAKVRH